MKVLFSFAILFLFCTAQADFEGEKSEEKEDFGYFSTAFKWSSSNIPVCWENPSGKYKDRMNQVRDAISDSWEFYSKLNFTGWKKCSKNESGIRIRIANSHPHTKGAGSQLSGKPDGMVLNFEFNTKDFSACNKDSTAKDLCVTSIAIHEFGHAIGFEHEHLRDDKDASCFGQASEDVGKPTKLSKYDPHSIMNYCNMIYNNNGRLSYGDVISVRKAYGKRGNGI